MNRIKQKLYRRPPLIIQTIFPQHIWAGNSKKIFLTFDDGPDPIHTPHLLSLLEKYKIKSSFFSIGKRAAKQFSLLHELSNEGHIIGNHSWSHPNLKWKSLSFIRDEITRCHEVIAELQGFRYILRPPFGAFGPNLIRVANELGYRLVIWSNAPGDYFDFWQPRDLADEITKNARAGDVLVLHDGHKNSGTTVKALEIAIPKLLENGFHFGSLDEMPAFKNRLNIDFNY